MLVKAKHGFDSNSEEEILTIAFKLSRQSECFAHASIRFDEKGLRKNFQLFENNISMSEQDTQRAIKEASKEASQLTDLFFRIMPFRKSVSLAFLDCCNDKHDDDWLSATLVLDVLEHQIPEEF